jgi:DNA modification methylase
MRTSQLILGDFDELAAEIPDGSVQLCFTDPPYPRRLAVPCFEMLARHLPRILADGGSLVTIVPHYLLKETISIIGNSLKYRWIYNMDQSRGPHPRMAMGIEVCWKPMLHYVKTAYPSGRGFLRDMVSILAPEKDLHPWQQAERWCEYYLEKLTEPGDLVLDPFAGTGTVPAVAHRLYRRYLAYENDPDTYDQAARRLHDSSHLGQ